MKTLILFYSYTGKSKDWATKLAKKQNADLVEVKEKKMRSKFNAYVFGSFAARGQKQSDISPIGCNFTKYEKIIIVMPIWAGYPAPPMNNVLAALPNGMNIELILTSGSGNSKGSAEKTKALIASHGLNLTQYTDIKC